ncbi:Unknown protein, partial [Striga hermonthica]
ALRMCAPIATLGLRRTLVPCSSRLRVRTRDAYSYSASASARVSITRAPSAPRVSAARRPRVPTNAGIQILLRAPVCFQRCPCLDFILACIIARCAPFTPSRAPSTPFSPIAFEHTLNGHGSQPSTLSQSPARHTHPSSSLCLPRLLASEHHARLFLEQGLHQQQESLAFALRFLRARLVLRFLGFSLDCGPHPLGQSLLHEGRYIVLDGSSSMLSKQILRSSPSSSSDSPGLMNTSVSFPSSSRLSFSSRIRKFSAPSSSPFWTSPSLVPRASTSCRSYSSRFLCSWSSSRYVLSHGVTSQPTPASKSSFMHPCVSSAALVLISCSRASSPDARHSPPSRAPSTPFSPIAFERTPDGHGSQPSNLAQSPARHTHPSSSLCLPRLLASEHHARLFLEQGLHQQLESLAFALRFLRARLVLRFLGFRLDCGPHPLGQSLLHEGRYIGLDGSSSMFSNQILRSSPSSSSDSPGLMNTSVSFPSSSRLS